MARKKQPTVTAFQLTYERILRIAVLLLAIAHMWLSFARHFFSPENNMSASQTLQTMFKAEKWFAVALLAAFILYLILSFTKFKDTAQRVRTAFRRTVSADGVLLTCVVAYFLLCWYVHSRSYTNIFKISDIALFDTAVCVFVLFTLPIVLGPQKARKYLDVILHAVMLFSTAFIVWGLWNLFHLNIVTLPSGLQFGMSDQFSLYPGVNQNIGAAIGAAMVLISMYMIASHGWIVKLIYAVAMVPHLYATLLTNSRGNYLSLLVAFPLFAFMLTWDCTRKKKTVNRVVIGGIAAAAAAAAIWALRRSVFWSFDQITHFSEYLQLELDGWDVARDISIDPARLRIWRSSINLMGSGAREFLFGSPLPLIPSRIESAMIKVYGSGSEYAHAHNVILQTGLVSGVPGMLLFLAFLIKMIFPCMKVGVGKYAKRYKGSYMLPIAVLSLLVSNMFEPFLLFYISVSACLFFLFCGSIVAINKERKTEA